MIITRTPLRISIGGGGTDLPSYYEAFGGFVISAAINKHVYITVNRTFRPGYFIKYSSTETATDIDEIQHPIVREAVRRMEIAAETEIVSIADVPAGTGLGSSGSFTVGLLHALHAHRRMHVGTSALAHMANDLEMNGLGEPCGKQDHYIAAYGGIMCQTYHPDGTVHMARLEIDETTRRRLSEGLMLFFTGYSRTAADVLVDQKTRSESGDTAMLENLHFIKDLGQQIKGALENGQPEGFAELMHAHWLHKKERSGNISNPRINQLYDEAREHGAIGGKLVGAGGGGFLMFYTRDRERLRAAMTGHGLTEMDFTFDDDGSIVQLRS